MGFLYWYKQILSYQHYLFLFWFCFLSYLCNCGFIFLFGSSLYNSSKRFNFNPNFILLFEKTGLVFIFVGVVSLTLNNLPFVLKVGVRRKISEPNKSYSNLSKTALLTFILPTVLGQ